MRNKPILSSERILHKDYDSMGWVTKKKNAVVFSHNGLGNKIN
jgi:hypothetical protein